MTFDASDITATNASPNIPAPIGVAATTDPNSVTATWTISDSQSTAPSWPQGRAACGEKNSAEYSHAARTASAVASPNAIPSATNFAQMTAARLTGRLSTRPSVPRRRSPAMLPIVSRIAAIPPTSVTLCTSTSMTSPTPWSSSPSSPVAPNQRSSRGRNRTSSGMAMPIRTKIPHRIASRYVRQASTTSFVRSSR